MHYFQVDYRFFKANDLFIEQKRLEQQTADHQREMDEARRKRTLERAKSTRKLKETQEKLNESVLSGSQLQKTIHNLQVCVCVSLQKLVSNFYFFNSLTALFACS